MNGYTKEIAEMLNISIEEATKVQDYLEEEMDIDYSEISERAFKRQVRFAAFQVNISIIRNCIVCNQKQCICEKVGA